MYVHRVLELVVYAVFFFVGEIVTIFVVGLQVQYIFVSFSYWDCIVICHRVSFSLTN